MRKTILGEDCIETPLYKLYDDDNAFFIKRDDLLPFAFGGNKVRIAAEYIKDMYSKNKDCIIGYGGVKSNLVRALSWYCVRLQIPCIAVCPVDDGSANSFNERISAMCGVTFFKCHTSEVAATVEKAFEFCEERGLSPYYINGNKFGEGNESTPVHAYVSAYKEILHFERENDLNFDYIFLPTGTGMTQAGLLCGAADNNSKTKVIGVSIARRSGAAAVVLKKYLDSFTARYNYKKISDNDIHITDAYLCGGYGKYHTEVEAIVHEIYKEHGIPLDTTYSGKAFYGMMQFIQEAKINKKNILFLHTGGTPLFFDYVMSQKEKIPVKRYTDVEKLLAYLYKIDKELPVPLSVRCDIEEYASKVLKNGVVLGIEEAGELCSASLFYCNDMQSRVAYLTLLGSLSHCSGKGYASILLDASVSYSKDCGMNEFTLDTNITNNKAIGLYSRKGFVIDSVKDKVYMKKYIWGGG